MKIPIEIKGGGYDGKTHVLDLPADRLNEIRSLGITLVTGAVVNFPVISCSPEKVILDGEKMTWEKKVLSVRIQGGEHEGVCGSFQIDGDIDIEPGANPGGEFTTNIKGKGEITFPVLSITKEEILLDGLNARKGK